MAITEGYTANFQTLLAAARNQDLALIECTDAKTGVSVITICAIERGDEYRAVPLAKMFDGSPYEELIPPTITEDAAG